MTNFYALLLLTVIEIALSVNTLIVTIGIISPSKQIILFKH